MPLAHRHGPCAPVGANTNRALIAERLRQDLARRNLVVSNDAELSDAGVKIPTALGGAVDSQADYVVTLGLGTPPVLQTVLIDTGRDLSWALQLRQLLPAETPPVRSEQIVHVQDRRLPIRRVQEPRQGRLSRRMHHGRRPVQVQHRPVRGWLEHQRRVQHPVSPSRTSVSDAATTMKAYMTIPTGSSGSARRRSRSSRKRRSSTAAPFRTAFHGETTARGISPSARRAAATTTRPASCSLRCTSWSRAWRRSTW
jgi:hypothetical protein